MVKYNLSQLLYYDQKLGSAVAVASSRKLLTVLFARLPERFTSGFQEGIENLRFRKALDWEFLFLAATRHSGKGYDIVGLTK